MVVYLDVLILENFLINLFLVVITMQLCRRNINYKSIIIASFLGTIYTLTMVIDSIKVFSYFPFKILFSLLMIKIALGKINILTLIKTTLVFIGSTIGFSGVCLFLSLMDNSYDISKGIVINSYSMKALIFSIIVFYLIAYRIYCYFKERAIINNFLFDIEFTLDNKVVQTKAFLDTGNELIEPVTSLPVIILEKKEVNYYKLEDSKCFHIPYKGVGGASEKMKAIKVKDVKLKNKDGVEFFRTAMVGFCDTKLSETDEYNALLPRAII
ncbi:sigma-E processing peptidase SpoIIGA [Clostridium massiliamazoniense]|uniref:sigma-E processing peptidase SpoIIGA n=1 Tax=Clostridium massiliamazoniense TaxID=1347366 RepID=UPI0006D7C37C|nr:sigma-E processing peptidase SpoIIGA [Clostridium massiliamazoniense]